MIISCFWYYYLELDHLSSTDFHKLQNEARTTTQTESIGEWESEGANVSDQVSITYFKTGYIQNNLSRWAQKKNTAECEGENGRINAILNRGAN